MNPKPLIMSGQNPVLIRDGLKTQTRRIMRPQPPCSLSRIAGTNIWSYTCSDEEWKPPYQPGDIRYIAEGYWIKGQIGFGSGATFYGEYTADDRNFAVELTSSEYWKFKSRKGDPFKKLAARFMYRSLARTWVEILTVKAERIQDISEEDAKAEGVERNFKPEDIGKPGIHNLGGYKNYLWHGRAKGKVMEGWYYQFSDYKTARDSFSSLWELIHGPDAWERNDWVWAAEFKRVDKPED